jgi:ATP-binding cassette, subfamily B, bacterial
MRRRTVIVIAHRPSTLRNFDRIVVLQAGRMMEDGSPDHLMQRDGLYRTVVKREMSHFAQQAASGVHGCDCDCMPAKRWWELFRCQRVTLQ